MTKTKSIEQEANATLRRLEQKDRGLKQLLSKAYGYAVFPLVGKASLVIGGSYGKGAVFERGRFIGYATIGQTTVGVQIGGDTFTEIIVFENKQAFDRMKRGQMAFAADASAVLVKAGAAAARGFGDGTRAFVYGDGGMLLEAAIGGQRFNFKPAGDEEGKKGGGKKTSRGDQQEESAEPEEEDSSGAGVMSAIRDTMSGVAGFAKDHPVAASIAGVTLAGGAAWVIAKMFWPSGQTEQGSDQQDDSNQQMPSDEDQAEQSQGQEEEENAEDDQDDQTASMRRGGNQNGGLRHRMSTTAR